MPNAMTALENLLKATTMRHKVLASNIANSDTPGYKAKDLNFRSIVQEESMAMATNNKDHIAMQGKGIIGEPVLIERQPWEDGNDVEVDDEIARMTQNSLMNEAATRILTIKINQYKVALRSHR